jgi:acetyl esterase/lipase
MGANPSFVTFRPYSKLSNSGHAWKAPWGAARPPSGKCVESTDVSPRFNGMTRRLPRFAAASLLLLLTGPALWSAQEGAAPARVARGPGKANAKKGTVQLVATPVKSSEVVYKTTPQGELKLHVFSPAGDEPAAAPRPCAVFFFGGGWRSGSYLQFVPQAEYLASRGIVAVSADYRIFNVASLGYLRGEPTLKLPAGAPALVKE